MKKQTYTLHPVRFYWNDTPEEILDGIIAVNIFVPAQDGDDDNLTLYKFSQDEWTEIQKAVANRHEYETNTFTITFRE